jgi:hypothetical protein
MACYLVHASAGLPVVPNHYVLAYAGCRRSKRRACGLHNLDTNDREVSSDVQTGDPVSMIFIALMVEDDNDPIRILPKRPTVGANVDLELGVTTAHMPGGTRDEILWRVFPRAVGRLSYAPEGTCQQRHRDHCQQ